ncbi:MAG TPA: TPM domain-containing protein [Pirellulales bacterium]|nr:TPM domain-containing protein [Pirellulales bacterium]
MRRSAVASAALCIAWAVVLVCQAAALGKQLDIPPSQDYVIDTAQIVSPEERRDMDGWLEELQDKTGDQIKVLTVRTTNGEDFFTFVERQFEHWKLGQRGKSNGALIALDVNDHKVRIHTGYGLEEALPDAWCGSLSRDVVTKFFKAGRDADGLDYLVRAVAFRVAQQCGFTLRGIPEQVHHPADETKLPAWAALLIVLVVILMLYYGSRNSGRGGPRQGSRVGAPWMMAPWIGSGSWGNSGWGGSFGGGSMGGGTYGGGTFGGGGSTGGGGGGASW